MKKKLLIFIVITAILVLLFFLSYKEESQFNKFTKIEIDLNPVTYDTLNKKDTLKHIFELKNTTKVPFVIDKVIPSCNCLNATYDKKVSNLGEITKIYVHYVPKETDFGNTKISIFVQCNAEKGLVKLELLCFINEK